MKGFNSSRSLSSELSSHLNHFSRLAELPWANGQPIVDRIAAAAITAYSSGATELPSAASASSWTVRLLMLATRLSPSGASSTAWLRMADWCYLRGRRQSFDSSFRF
ncbi:unnamed protein product [Protopolystoma xenopodis]|uniref:Uncharacterized protein n=1 Tax=Protopolystoma xenopodis TaxID=117903 RepID=A0A448XRB4_9PLAT|nr:unnamed protein product [Protopolystoma xenopodis]